LSAAKKRDSNLLFALSSSVFENFFSHRSPTWLSLQPANRLIRQQQRGEILICFRSIVKHFRKILFSALGDSLKPARVLRPPHFSHRV
jgi:hypothetical protein